MSILNSSTSSFSFGESEKIPFTQSPTAIIAFISLVMLVELILFQNKEWYADQAAWYWQVKKELLEEGKLEADVVILGTSVTLHGINASEISIQDRISESFTNLALNGLTLQYQAQFFKQYVQKKGAPSELVLELRNCKLDPLSWQRGPAWRFWSSTSELFASDFYFWAPGRYFEFICSRLLTSYAYRKSVDNWFFECCKAKSITNVFLLRNKEIRNEMSESAGFALGNFTKGLTSPKSPRPRPFEVNRSGLYWLKQILDICQNHGIQLTFFKPPVPSFVRVDRELSNYDEQFDEFVRRRQMNYPELNIRVFSPQHFELSDFADDRHLSHQGAVALTSAFSKSFQLRDYRER